MPISPPPLTLEGSLVDGNLEKGLPRFEFSYTGSKTDCADTSDCMLGSCLALFCCPPCFWLCQLSRIPFISFRVKDVWIPSVFYMLDVATLLLYMAYRINHKS